jgi:hypothetical protein
MVELNVGNILVAQIYEAKHSGSPLRKHVAEDILQHSGVVHEEIPAGTSTEATAEANYPLESDDVQPAMEAVQQLSSLAVSEQLEEGSHTWVETS